VNSLARLTIVFNGEEFSMNCDWKGSVEHYIGLAAHSMKWEIKKDSIILVDGEKVNDLKQIVESGQKIEIFDPPAEPYDE